MSVGETYYPKSFILHILLVEFILLMLDCVCLFLQFYPRNIVLRKTLLVKLIV